MEIKTLNDIYTVTCSLDRPAAMKYKRDGKWVDTSVDEFRDTVRYFATGLRLLGLKAGDRVAILSENRPEWAMADFAILASAAVTVPVYPTLLGWQIEYILNDSGAVAVICSNEEQMKKVAGIRDHCPHIHNVIVCDPPPKLPDGVLSFAQVVESGRNADDDAARHGSTKLRAKPKPDDLATLVYTSGTTGNPKGAMLTHGNIASNVLATGQGPADRARRWSASPSCRSRTSSSGWATTAYFYRGCTIAYAESVIKVGDNLREIRPRALRRRAAPLREDAHHDPGQRRRAAGVEAEDLQMGARHRRAAAAVSRRAASRCRSAWRSNRRSPTSSSSARSSTRLGGRVKYRPLRRRAALGGAGRVLHRRGPRDLRRLRPHRDLAGHRRQHARQARASAPSARSSPASK